MIKKVRILDIHPDDAWCPYKDEIIGNVYMLDISMYEYRDGWSSSDVTEEAKYSDDMSDVNYHEFLAFKYEEVS